MGWLIVVVEAMVGSRLPLCVLSPSPGAARPLGVRPMSRSIVAYVVPLAPVAPDADSHVERVASI